MSSHAILPRSFTKQYPVAARAHGARIWDTQGREYIDLSGSAVVNFIGFGNDTVVQAMAEQASRLPFVHSSQFTSEIAEHFAAEVLDFAGPAFEGGAVFFTCGGSEAVETALKLARQFQVETGHPDRCEIISRQQAYHGSTLGALAVSGNLSRREIYLPMVREFEHIRIPYCYRCEFSCELGCDDCGRKYADDLRHAIEHSAGRAAAFIGEPISGATLGAVAPPPIYWPAIASICKEHGLLLIADEVMTGFGRTGRNFAMDHWNVAPDILVAGKGIGSGYAPLGAVIVSARVVDALRKGSGMLIHGFTYNAHPVSMAAGSAVLAHIREMELVQAADSEHGSIGQAFMQALHLLEEIEAVGDVRGLGLLHAVEFVRDRATREAYPAALKFSGKVAAAALKRGVLTYPMQGSIDGTRGDHILLAPPAVELDRLLEAVHLLGDAIREASDQAARS
ncbi:aminotransferase [Candidatus Koribacter versatilis Ellin345]|uniref:Aminotransferase n=1 Tax=Koribacter versatilis (strain Ellin345) TaxID=204669 RepID=Q1IJP5_KORVE|nr:aminotransferase class III-fold pyridoxal phosphate-dependent enzyme [Candidatus Koribacter versatilis]ABF42905.1 aminotransferase [Candidatus Koribacter versatilis Ellin345]